MALPTKPPGMSDAQWQLNLQVMTGDQGLGYGYGQDVKKPGKNDGFIQAIADAVAEDIRMAPHAMDFLSGKYWNPETPKEQKDLALKALMTIGSYAIPMGIGKIAKAGWVTTNMLGPALGNALMTAGDPGEPSAGEILGSAAAGAAFGGALGLAGKALGRFGKKAVDTGGGGKPVPGQDLSPEVSNALAPRPPRAVRRLNTVLDSEIKAAGIASEEGRLEFANQLLKKTHGAFEEVDPEGKLALLNHLRTRKGVGAIDMDALAAESRTVTLFSKRTKGSKWELSFTDDAVADAYEFGLTKEAEGTTDATIADMIVKAVRQKPYGKYTINGLDDVVEGRILKDAPVAQAAAAPVAQAAETAVEAAAPAAAPTPSYVVPKGYNGPVKEILRKGSLWDPDKKMVPGGELMEDEVVWLHPNKDRPEIVEGKFIGVVEKERTRKDGTKWVEKMAMVQVGDQNIESVWTNVSKRGIVLTTKQQVSTTSATSGSGWRIVPPNPKLATGLRGKTETGIELPDGKIVYIDDPVETRDMQRVNEYLLTDEMHAKKRAAAIKEAETELVGTLQTLGASSGQMVATGKRALELYQRSGDLHQAVELIKTELWKGNEKLRAIAPEIVLESKIYTRPHRKVGKHTIIHGGTGIEGKGRINVDTKRLKEEMINAGEVTREEFDRAAFLLKKQDEIVKALRKADVPKKYSVTEKEPRRVGTLYAIRKTTTGGYNVMVKLPDGTVTPAMSIENIGSVGMKWPARTRDALQMAESDAALEAAVRKNRDKIVEMWEKNPDNWKNRARRANITKKGVRPTTNQLLGQIRRKKDAVENELFRGPDPKLNMTTDEIAEWRASREKTLKYWQQQELHQERLLKFIDQGGDPAELEAYLKSVKDTEAFNIEEGTNVPVPAAPVPPAPGQAPYVAVRGKSGGMELVLREPVGEGETRDAAMQRLIARARQNHPDFSEAEGGLWNPTNNSFLSGGPESAQMNALAEAAFGARGKGLDFPRAADALIANLSHSNPAVVAQSRQDLARRVRQEGLMDLSEDALEKYLYKMFPGEDVGTLSSTGEIVRSTVDYLKSKTTKGSRVKTPGNRVPLDDYLKNEGRGL